MTSQAADVLALTPDGLPEFLRAALARFIPHADGANGMRRAAVLLPLLFKGSEPYILFTRRTEDVPTHKGQISFPGGGVEPSDPDLQAAALRETQEEIGIPPGAVEVLGRLDDLHTFSRTFVITPHVGIIPDGIAKVTSDREVASILEIPLRFLLDPVNRVPDLEMGHWRYPWQGQEVWGATARILNQFLGILGLVDPFVEDLEILRELTDPRDRLRFAELMKTFHPKGQSVARFVRHAPASVATPAIHALARVAGGDAPQEARPNRLNV